MKISSCNCHYSLVCCSKSSDGYDVPNSQKSQCSGGQNVSTQIPSVLKEKDSDEEVVIEQKSTEDGNCEILLKSSLKKPRTPDSEQVVKGNVKWIDLSGKELIEIKEFELSMVIGITDACWRWKNGAEEREKKNHRVVSLANLMKMIITVATEVAFARFNDNNFFALNQLLDYHGSNVQLMELIHIDNKLPPDLVECNLFQIVGC